MTDSGIYVPLSSTFFFIFVHLSGNDAETEIRRVQVAGVVKKNRRWLLWKGMCSAECRFIYNFNLKCVWIVLISHWKSNDCDDLPTQGPLQSTYRPFSAASLPMWIKENWTLTWDNFHFESQKILPATNWAIRNVGIYRSVIKGTTSPATVVPHNEDFCSIDPHEGRDQTETRRYRQKVFCYACGAELCVCNRPSYLQ